MNSIQPQYEHVKLTILKIDYLLKARPIPIPSANAPKIANGPTICTDHPCGDWILSLVGEAVRVGFNDFARTVKEIADDAANGYCILCSQCGIRDSRRGWCLVADPRLLISGLFDRLNQGNQ
jgi:hypothetical protein